jgi:hypothetical protein
MKKIVLTFFLLIMNHVFCQVKNDDKLNKIYLEIYGKCFKNLEPIEETKNIISLENVSFCKLYQCVAGVGYTKDERNIQDAILKRAVEITTRLYNEGTPIYLMIGMDSFGEAEEKNQDLTDDNNLVYISIAQCISSESLEKIKEIVNKTTSQLIKTGKKNIQISTNN